MRCLERAGDLASGSLFCHDLFVTDYWTGSSTTHRIVTHLVFCAKYRRRVLFGKIAKRIEALFIQCCQMNKWEIHELGFDRDHVHMMIQTRPGESLADVVQLLKGGSSRVIRQEHPELEEFLWGDSFWSDGYFAESIGTKNESVMKAYIKKQNKS